MNKGNNKRGFIPPQPAAAISALDFAHASEALRRAHEAASVVQGNAATETVAEVIAQCADRLIGIPTTNPAHIAEKVAAYAWLHNGAADLSDQAAQWRIAEGDDDAAKGLLAIYLDLTGHNTAEAAKRAAWDSALAAYKAAQAKADALLARPCDTDDLYDAASDEAWDLLEALLALPAPDGIAMGEKARAIIAQAHSDYWGDDPDNPATIARLLAGDWSEQALASLYIDGLRLSGSDSPIVNVTPDAFDPAAWLAEVEAATGARLSKSDCWGNTAFVPTHDEADVEGATAQLKALYPDHADQVGNVAVHRDRNVDLSEPWEPMTPEREAAAREALIDGLANLSAKGGDRDLIRAKIAQAARPWVLTVEERGAGLVVREGDQ